MKKKIFSILLCSVMVCSLMVGCGKKEEPATEATTEATTEEASTEYKPEGMERSYLTGEWIDEELAKQRPVAFMIENTSASVPSHNSSKADVYYEAPEEGGITRIMALYTDYSGMDTIGNIRSTRPYFAYTAIAFDSILAHCGGSIETYQWILDQGLVDNLDERLGALGYFRSNDKSAPHNLFTSSDGVAESIKDKGYSTEYAETYEGYLNFNTDDENEITLEDGQDAAVIKVYQPDCKPWFVYNEEDGLYYRYEFGKEQMDCETDTQLAVKNVIIQECSVEAYYDEQNHDRVDVGITGEGEGIYLTNGKAIHITWKCNGYGKVTKYYDLEGNEIELNQGKTWINIVDKNHSSDNVIYGTYDDFESAK
ncbi:MAG: DUF3048 domain-containing protein [Lachnospiraceae bacterium]